MKRFLTGIQPSGEIHIGNYFGAIKPAIELQEENSAERFYFIANLHSLTSFSKMENSTLEEKSLQMAIDWMACGWEEEKSILFLQSDIPEVLELYWILSSVCPMGLLERCHAYKDKIADGISSNHALFSYPVLMASDILLYQTTCVPVGKDQRQHLEISRELARKMNDRLGEEFFILPEIYAPEKGVDSPEILGLDKRKMSKSYGNTIPVFGEKEAMRKLFMGIRTDSTPVKDPKPTKNSLLLYLYSFFSSEEDLEKMKSSFETGGYGYGEYKQQLFESYWEYFQEMRGRREDLMKESDKVKRILNQGKEKARTIAINTLHNLKEKIGLPLT